MTSEGLASWIVDNMNKIPKRRGMVGNLAILKNWSLGIVVLDTETTQDCFILSISFCNNNLSTYRNVKQWRRIRILQKVFILRSKTN
jgi:hypothetical protein